MSTLSKSSDFMRELLLGGQFSDIDIICQDVTFKAHRAIVCTQSRFFNSAFCDGFKESFDRSINLKDETPETIERVLSFLYLREYQDEGNVVLFRPSTDDSDSVSQGDKFNEMEALKSKALNNILVFTAADKFEIDPLKNLASEKFSEWVSGNWDSSIFPEVVEEALALTPSHETKLQEIIAVVISSHIFELIDKAAILPVLSSFGCLGSLVILDLVQKGLVKQPSEKDVLQGLAQKLNSRRHCRHCSAALNVRMESGEYQIGNFRCAVCHTRH
ncbi:BTB/POZ protein [Penicillium verhagenii]|uniref:BTB/POZ protein n=1 Tax=Penicillium verhagenii TaxID=1562060 RepID=UPI00254582B7|nr:BTB/POZ protein [Penicillium verhagenii]KAJ5938430.1 BTB/POZ protein [Penicillium verhagenii]